MYINCKTYFSFRFGTFATDELVKKAAALGIRTLALTNINNTCDAWDFVKNCVTANIKPVIGTEIRNEDNLLYIILAKNRGGFAAINSFLSEHLLSGSPFPPRPSLRETDCFVVYPFSIGRFHELRSHEFIGVQYTEINRLHGVQHELIAEKCVARHPVTFQSKGFYTLHRILRAVQHNVLYTKISPRWCCQPHESLISPDEMRKLFARYPKLIANSNHLLDSCSVSMDFGRDKTKKVFSNSRVEDRAILRKLAHDGIQSRYAVGQVVLERVEKELCIIDKLDFNAYFLIAWDIIRYAKAQGYHHVGRGSGANSIVAYCLGITDVDPIGLELFFERFLNPHRACPPDFDIDFSHAVRDEIFKYIFNRYGDDHVALLAVYTTFQYKSTVQALGKVFGMPENERSHMSDAPERNYTIGSLQYYIAHYYQFLSGFPDHLGIHAGGIVISEEPLSQYTALYMPPKGFATTQIDMYFADEIGLYKLDILSQRGLGHIWESLDIIRRNRGITINIHDVERFKNDPNVNHNLSTGNSIGCFYIESPAMRHVLQKLHCEDYDTLVAASSIIRPGVGRSGMMNAYISRHNKTKYHSLHPELARILRSTYEVMVYQEDIIRVVHEWAGLSMAEADLLRRATSFKYRVKDQMGFLKDRFFSACHKKGYKQSISAEVWRQIESFAEFSFCKAHSASFAVESYQSLYLKTYYPKEFMVAVINNFGGFYGTELYFYELQKAGALVHPPCVNSSMMSTHINGDDVFVGFQHVKNLRAQVADRIISERASRGHYGGLQDFIQRSGITDEQCRILIRVGALRFTGQDKKTLLWELAVFAYHREPLGRIKNSLFRSHMVASQIPTLPEYQLDDAYDELEILEFPTSNPFHLVDDDPGLYVPANKLRDHVGRKVTVLGYHVTHKPVRTVSGERMSFGTFIDAAGNWIDSVQFPDTHNRVTAKAGFYRITGTVIEDFGVFSLEAAQFERVGLKHRRSALKRK